MFKTLIICCMCICSCTLAFFHVENIAKVDHVPEVEETEEVYQEEQQQEFMVVEPVEDQVLETDFANSESQQGKHRKHLPSSLY